MLAKKQVIVGNHLKTKTDTVYKIGLLISFLIGIVFRIFHLFKNGFNVPFNMGGLFYQMSIEIIKSDFFLPVSIPYYFPGGLPFAYPPLPFYIQAIIIKFFSPDLFLSINTLPPFFSIFSLFGFYFLTQKVIKNKTGVVAAVFTFSIIPIAFSEQIEAMGLAESIGTLFLILYTSSLLSVSEKKRRRSWMIPGILLGFCVMSSPGSIYASILISILFFGISAVNSIRQNDIKFLIDCLVVGFVGLIVSFPYWFTVISHHGIGIFINTFTAENTKLFSSFLETALDLRFIDASPFWNILFLFSLFSAIIKKKYLLILYSIVLMFIPREYWIMSIPVSLLIGIGIVTLLDLLGSIPKINANLLKTAVIWTMILFFLIDSSFSLYFLIDDDTYDISAVQINDLNNVKKSSLIPSDAYVFVAGNWGLVEWSPALIQRMVINNPFGLEWVPVRYEKIFPLTENLLETVDPDAIMKILQEDFNDISSVYIIADHDYLDKLDCSHRENTTEFETLQAYDDLGLGLITVRN